MDKRELILLRIKAILEAVPGITGVFRDRGEFPDDKRPVVVLLDGAEIKLLGPEALGRSRPGENRVAPSIMSLRPQIFFIDKVKAKRDSEEYGPELSAWRVRLLKALMQDPQLIALVGPNGDIEYLGSDTDMQTGRSMEGELQINFAFRYVFNPRDL